MTYIRLDKLRAQYKPQIPHELRGEYTVTLGLADRIIGEDSAKLMELLPNTYSLPWVFIEPVEDEVTLDELQKDPSKAKKKKKTTEPINVGVVLSGGQAPGGHNVIGGIFDAIKQHNEASRLFGFLMGPGGLLRHEYKELTSDIINRYRNSGGFDMIGSDRTKLETKEQFEKVLSIAKELQLKALVIIGGDDSNTNAALLAEYAKKVGSNLQVIGCPKTIDGDLKNHYIETSFGFDTCVKVYSELIGNIQRDCFSAKKYYHFIKLMGRAASHITLECALMTQPTMAIISEEIADRKITLPTLIKQIADVVVARWKNGLTFGTLLIPEGLVEFLPNMGKLIRELNDLLAKQSVEALAGGNLQDADEEEIIHKLAEKLSPESAELLRSFPTDIAIKLASDRDPHGNVQVSQIPTEELLATLVAKELERRKEQGEYGGKFAALTHFFGYEGRCSMPSNFDASYCYALGRCAVYLILENCSGYMATIGNLTAHPLDWQAAGYPFSFMMSMEKRKGKEKPVIAKSLVDLHGAPMKYFRHNRKNWANGVHFHYPGPLQFFGPSAICDNTTITLRLEHGLSAYEDPVELLHRHS